MLFRSGIAREFVNRVQNLRKDKGFELTDRIVVSIEESNPIVKYILVNTDYISSEVLADKIALTNSLSNTNEVEIDDVKFWVGVERI